MAFSISVSRTTLGAVATASSWARAGIAAQVTTNAAASAMRRNERPDPAPGTPASAVHDNTPFTAPARRLRQLRGDRAAGSDRGAADRLSSRQPLPPSAARICRLLADRQDVVLARRRRFFGVRRHRSRHRSRHRGLDRRLGFDLALELALVWDAGFALAGRRRRLGFVGGRRRRGDAVTAMPRLKLLAGQRCETGGLDAGPRLTRPRRRF